MHQWSISQPQQGGSGQRTSQDRSSRRGTGMPAGAGLWLWLLLGALALVPGAWSSLSEEQEELLVELHNHYRGQVSPSASAMLPLVRHLLSTAGNCFISNRPMSPFLMSMVTNVTNETTKQHRKHKYKKTLQKSVNFGHFKLFECVWPNSCVFPLRQSRVVTILLLFKNWQIVSK